MSTVTTATQVLDKSEVDRRISQAAAGLRSLGVGPGDGVALCLRNDVAFFEVSMGAGQIGAYPVAVNWHYTVDEFRYLLEDCQAKVLVIHADLLHGLREAIPAGVAVLVVPVDEAITRAYGIGPERGRVAPSDTDWNLWREGFPARAEAPADMPSTIIYTSGTTGRPKGVRRPQASAEQAAVRGRMLATSYGFSEYLDRPEDITMAVVGPIYHSAPNANANFSYKLGANIVITPRFDPLELLQLIERHRVTHLNMVPIMFNRLLKLPEEERKRYDLSSLRFVVHAAAPCSPAVKRAMIDWWGPVINEYYGSTEMGNITFCSAQEWLDHPGTVGRTLMPGTEIRILDPDGKPLPTGEIGEVAARVHGMGDFTYHGDDAKRRKADRDGMIAPGDVGYFDADGFLYLCDRANDMIISGGVNIYPAEIEAQLHAMPGVADCAVFGIPDEEFGESVCAIVEAQPGAELTENDVTSYLRGVVAGYKLPRRIEFRTGLPREDSGKIFKRKLREPFWENAGRSI
ncbi:acyl-CoA synthetase [Chelatococcus reniformis]|uniref:3-methylmercaptopropionyl-CoA ligase n=1 Tax=Chelatococcus reniformis TaxID=1494448 RepID=A0A916U876_9HYPH|nr:acyl-CoA synthetase [Chelatococcus reniformis]GGC61600.1 acyl-CoA synthetase [Chelatococcus reniformis]